MSLFVWEIGSHDLLIARLLRVQWPPAAKTAAVQMLTVDCEGGSNQNIYLSSPDSFGLFEASWQWEQIAQTRLDPTEDHRLNDASTG